MHVVRAAQAIEEPEVTSLSNVDYGELSRRIEDGDTSFVLVNVLPRAAFETGRIPGSLNLPLAEIAERAGEVLPARDQETVVYCASSACSLAEQGVILLRSLGYTRVREYPGGMEEWNERGGRIEHLLTCLPSNQPRSGSLRRSLRRIAQLGADLCGVCTARPMPEAVRSWMDRIHRLCHGLCDEPRLGDPAPRFELPGSDGRIHRLADYLGLRPVVLTWFPKAFTGG